jgi:hypothetical protein
VAANSPAPPPVESWQAHYLRLIAFPVEPAYGIAQTWWEQLIGTAADNIADQKQKRTREEFGTTAGANLVLSIDPARVQWTAAHIEETDAPVPGLPVIGPFVERKGWFVPLMQRWLASCPPVNRLAFIAVLNQPAENRVEAYRLLDRYLRHVEIDAEGSDSLLYRINRKRASEAVPGLAINRLSTWIAGRTELVRAVGLPSGENVQTERIESHSCRVELDINTVPDFSGGPLPQDRLADVFAEMAEMAHEIAATGDVRA